MKIKKVIGWTMMAMAPMPLFVIGMFSDNINIALLFAGFAWFWFGVLIADVPPPAWTLDKDPPSSEQTEDRKLSGKL